MIPILLASTLIAIMCVTFIPIVQRAGSNIITLDQALDVLGMYGYTAYAAPTGTFYVNDVLPNTDSTYDIGASGTEFAEGHFDDLYAPTGRTATYVVAASNAPAHVKAQADYVLSGINDMATINSLISAGVTIQITEGTINAEIPLVINASNVTITGAGRNATHIVASAAGPVWACMVEVGEGVTDIVVSDMHLDADARFDYAIGTANDERMVDYTNGPERVYFINIFAQDGADDVMQISSYAKYIYVDNSYIYRSKGAKAGRGVWSGIEIEDRASYVYISNTVSYYDNSGNDGAALTLHFSSANGYVHDIHTFHSYFYGNNAFVIDYNSADESIKHFGYFDVGSTFEAAPGKYAAFISGGRELSFIGSKFVLHDGSYGASVFYHSGGDIEFIGCEFHAEGLTGTTGESPLGVAGQAGTLINNVTVTDCKAFGGRNTSFNYIRGLSIKNLQIIEPRTGNRPLYITNSDLIDADIYVRHPLFNTHIFNPYDITNFKIKIRADQAVSGYYVVDFTAGAGTTANGAISVAITNSAGANGVRFQTGSVAAGANVVLTDSDFPSNLTTKVSDVDGNVIKYRNRGYITENSGTATITSGNTVVQVTHGLDVTPDEEKIRLVPLEDPTNTPGVIGVSANATDTYFWIFCENDPGASNLDIGWSYAN